MDAATIQSWIESLGLTYHELVTEGIIPKQPITALFDSPDNEDLIQEPIAGVELWFWADTERMEKILITLIQTVGQPFYTGQLPAPFTLNMNQSAVHQVLGNPETSKAPFKLPGGLGMRGGSDTYYLDQHVNPNVKVTFAYLENRTVNNISFALIDTGHD